MIVGSGFGAVPGCGGDPQSAADDMASVVMTVNAGLRLRIDPR